MRRWRPHRSRNKIGHNEEAPDEQPDDVRACRPARCGRPCTRAGAGSTAACRATAAGSSRPGRADIYTCEKTAEGYRWTFAGPEAALFDASGRQIGTHFSGPTWQLDDGSKITARTTGQAPALQPHAIDWLLLRVTTHEGTGALSGVGFVRRVDTQGGTPPITGCDAAQAAVKARMRYTARYLFYVAP